jgi:hypothetical protein
MGRSFWENPSPQQGSYVDPYRINPWTCGEDSGCMFVIRKIKDENRAYSIDAEGKRGLCRKPKTANEKEDEEDGDWVEKPNNEKDEPLEYVSDDEASCMEVETQLADIDMADADGNEDESLAREQIRKFWLQGMFETYDGQWVDAETIKRLTADNQDFPAWYRGNPYHLKPGMKDDVADEMFPLYITDHSHNSNHSERLGNEHDPTWPSDRKAIQSKLGYQEGNPVDIEHIAGPGCNIIEGYSGHEISAEEMRGCQTLQCLVRKPGGYVFSPLPDDEDFEKTGGYFLSGLSGHMPSRDYSTPRVKPVRHGREEPDADNYVWEHNASDVSMPFHPPCLEVYKRISLLLNGNVDMSALTSWWELEANYDAFHGFPRDPNVHKCKEQNWAHYKGTAYLVANPLYIPKMREIFEAAVETQADFSPRNGAFKILKPTTERCVMDLFESLPAEIRIGVLDCLSSRDIASLRLASRTFCQLPVGYFQKFLWRECPWLWEAWPTGAKPHSSPYAKWAFLTAGEVGETVRRQEYELAILYDYCSIVKKEMPKIGQQIDAAYEAHSEAMRDAHRLEFEYEDYEDRKPFYLPPTKTNYFTLYTLITRHWQELRGLQNRRRIWKDCEEILRRIGVYREEGRIGDNGAIGRL